MQSVKNVETLRGSGVTKRRNSSLIEPQVFRRCDKGMEFSELRDKDTFFFQFLIVKSLQTYQGSFACCILTLYSSSCIIVGETETAGI